MAIVVYKCDTCKREIGLQRNIDSMEHVGRCIITHGCRGKLYQINLHPDYIRGSLPPRVSGLDDWKQRKVLFNHTQAIEREKWVIQHNMGVVPSVSVFVDRPIEGNENNREEITPTDINIINTNIIELVFDRPWSGIAQLVASQSDPHLLEPSREVTTTTVAAQQLTNKGEMTLATNTMLFDPNTTYVIAVEYTTPTNDKIVIDYVLDSQPSIISPWIDYDKGAIIRGQIYTIRSFNALRPEMISGTIESGSTFRFVGVSAEGSPLAFAPIEQNNILILIADAPYETVDKKTDSYIDVTKVTETINVSSFYYNSGEFFANQQVISSVYPPIRSIQVS